jgi:hypothetical protein
MTLFESAKLRIGYWIVAWSLMLASPGHMYLLESSAIEAGQDRLVAARPVAIPYRYCALPGHKESSQHPRIQGLDSFPRAEAPEWFPRMIWNMVSGAVMTVVELSLIDRTLQLQVTVHYC